MLPEASELQQMQEHQEPPGTPPPRSPVRASSNHGIRRMSTGKEEGDYLHACLIVVSCLGFIRQSLSLLRVIVRERLCFSWDASSSFVRALLCEVSLKCIEHTKKTLIILVRFI